MCVVLLLHPLYQSCVGLHMHCSAVSSLHWNPCWHVCLQSSIVLNTYALPKSPVCVWE